MIHSIYSQYSQYNQRPATGCFPRPLLHTADSPGGIDMVVGAQHILVGAQHILVGAQHILALVRAQHILALVGAQHILAQHIVTHLCSGTRWPVLRRLRLVLLQPGVATPAEQQQDRDDYHRGCARVSGIYTYRGRFGCALERERLPGVQSLAGCKQGHKQRPEAAQRDRNKHRAHHHNSYRICSQKFIITDSRWSQGFMTG